VIVTLLAYSRMVSGQNCYVLDTFSDGSLSPTWSVDGTSGTIISAWDYAGQLQFWSSANIYGNDYRTYAWSSGWEVDMRHDWAIQADWYVQPSYPTTITPAGAGVGLAFGLTFDDPATADIDRGLTITALRGLAYPNQPYNIQAIDYWVDGGDAVTQVWEYRSWSVATMYVWYDAALGIIAFDQYPPGVGSTPMYATGVAGLSSESTATIGFGGHSYGYEAPSFAYSEVAIDDFCMLYGTLAGIRVGACVIPGGCFETIEESCVGSFTDGVTCEDICSCQWDPDCTGTCDVGDIQAIVDTWGPCPSCSTDLDDNGVVDVRDLLLLLEHWDDC
jgi:hypothetical protein